MTRTKRTDSNQHLVKVSKQSVCQKLDGYLEEMLKFFSAIKIIKLAFILLDKSKYFGE